MDERRQWEDCDVLGLIDKWWGGVGLKRSGCFKWVACLRSRWQLENIKRSVSETWQRMP